MQITKLATDNATRRVSKLEYERKSRKGLSRRKLSQLSGVGESTIYEAERGIKRPRVDTLMLLRDGINTFSTQMMAKKKVNYELVNLDDIAGVRELTPAQ